MHLNHNRRREYCAILTKHLGGSYPYAVSYFDLHCRSPWFLLPHLSHLWTNPQFRLEHWPLRWKYQQTFFFCVGGRFWFLLALRRLSPPPVEAWILPVRSWSTSDFKCQYAAASDWKVPPRDLKICSKLMFPLRPWQTMLRAGSKESPLAK